MCCLAEEWLRSTDRANLGRRGPPNFNLGIVAEISFSLAEEESLPLGQGLRSSKRGKPGLGMVKQPARVGLDHARTTCERA